MSLCSHSISINTGVGVSIMYTVPEIFNPTFVSIFFVSLYFNMLVELFYTPLGFYLSFVDQTIRLYLVF